MFVKDSAGVLAKISGLFAKGNISIKEVKQMTSGEGLAEIIIITHPAYESDMRKTVEKITAISEAVSVKGFIRIEE
ncbi:MAG: ACT domain-containing protein [Clostridia bacterium]|nr:ACT domain-containing protein [Clostridia bacterium]